MNGTIAQLIALACHGNACLAGKQHAASLSNNSAFQFCESVNFMSIVHSSTREIAATPEQWFGSLRDRSALRIRLRWKPSSDPAMPDRRSAGFAGGGGVWSLISEFPRNQMESWRGAWTIGNRAASDKRIWRVSYTNIAGEDTRATAAPRVSDALDELEASLVEIQAFSSRYVNGAFMQNFAKALETVQTRHRGLKLHGYHQDLFPKGSLSENAESALDACQSAFVFGAMGSWNDGLGNNAPKEYERVSERLFIAIIQAIIAATDTSAPTPA